MKHTVARFVWWILFVAFVTVTWINQVMNNWQQDDRILRNTAIVKELLDRSADRWTGEDQQRWAEECFRLNPGMKLPAAEFWPRKVVPKF